MLGPVNSATTGRAQLFSLLFSQKHSIERVQGVNGRKVSGRTHVVPASASEKARIYEPDILRSASR